MAQLDDRRNDIYVHISSKAEGGQDVWDYQPRYSNVFYARPQLDDSQGGVNGLKIEILLFETAIKRSPYARYHLLSENDSLLESMAEIHRFYGHPRNVGVEFLEYRASNPQEGVPAKDICRQRSVPNVTWLGRPRYGSRWGTLSERAVRYILEHRVGLLKSFRDTVRPEEHYKQMLLFAAQSFQIAGENKRLELYENGAPQQISQKQADGAVRDGFLFATLLGPETEPHTYAELTDMAKQAARAEREARERLFSQQAQNAGKEERKKEEGSDGSAQRGGRGALKTEL